MELTIFLENCPQRFFVTFVFDFQGRHKRNATFPGGQTTILQVTPTIRSKCHRSCYANFAAIHAVVVRSRYFHAGGVNDGVITVSLSYLRSFE